MSTQEVFSQSMSSILTISQLMDIAKKMDIEIPSYKKLIAKIIYDYIIEENKYDENDDEDDDEDEEEDEELDEVEDEKEPNEEFQNVE